jgi:DNA repair exonuclease SbcCD nuclease subunit
MRILHLADFHLDRPFVGLPPEAGKQRREGLFAALQRCLGLAEEHKVDLITIGGDLWEEEHVRADTRASVAHELGALGIPVLIVCGNHDRLLPGGSYRRTTWPTNVTVADQGVVTEHPHGEVSVWALSWGGGELSPQLIETLEVPSDGRTHILLVHGTAHGTGYGAGESYLPFDAERVREAGFAACLAGHIHCAVETAATVYPGSPEPLSWAEDGRHCVALVDAGAGEARVALLDVNFTRFETREIDCSSCGSSAEVEARLAPKLDDQDAERILLRVTLVGEVDPECAIDVARIRRRHGSRYAALLVRDATEPTLDISARSAGRGLDGMFVRALQERIEGATGPLERRRFELALEAGLRALDDRDVILRVD